MKDWRGRPLTEAVRLARFGAVGVAALAVYWFATNALTSIGGLPLMPASIVGYVAAGFTSYLGHTHFSFRVSANHGIYAVRFLVVALLGLLINVVLVKVCSAARMPAGATTTIIGVSMPLFNYAFNRLWVFGSGLDNAGLPKEML